MAASLTQSLNADGGNQGRPAALMFPAPLFRQISPAIYLHRHLLHDPPIRPNGRRSDQYRDFTLTTNSLSHAHGSAVVRTGDTAVVCGVRGEILTLAPGDNTLGFESYDSLNSAVHAYSNRGSGGASWGGLLIPNVELSTGCSKKYPLGAPSESAQTLSDQINELVKVSKVVDLESLRIYDDEKQENSSGRIKGYWSLYIDVLCISLDGNILDAAWYAVIAALKTVKLPLARWSGDEEQIFCDRLLQHPIQLRRHLPFVVSFALSRVPTTSFSDGPNDSTEKTFILNDPDAFEEDEAKEALNILSSTIRPENELEVPLVGNSTPVTKIETIWKVGGGNLDLERIGECAILASAKAADYYQRLIEECNKTL